MSAILAVLAVLVTVGRHLEEVIKDLGARVALVKELLSMIQSCLRCEPIPIIHEHGTGRRFILPRRHHVACNSDYSFAEGLLSCSFMATLSA